MRREVRSSYSKVLKLRFEKTSVNDAIYIPCHFRHPTRNDCADGNRRGKAALRVSFENAVAVIREYIYMEVNQKFWSDVDSGEVRSISAVGERQERTPREI